MPLQCLTLSTFQAKYLEKKNTKIFIILEIKQNTYRESKKNIILKIISKYILRLFFTFFVVPLY